MPAKESVLNPRAVRPSNRAVHMATTRIVARTTGGCRSVRKAYATVSSMAAIKVAFRGRRPVRKIVQNPYARMPTCRPEMERT
jgi:hypothetical protein